MEINKFHEKSPTKPRPNRQLIPHKLKTKYNNAFSNKPKPNITTDSATTQTNKQGGFTQYGIHLQYEGNLLGTDRF